MIGDDWVIAGLTVGIVSTMGVLSISNIADESISESEPQANNEKDNKPIKKNNNLFIHLLLILIFAHSSYSILPVI